MTRCEAAGQRLTPPRRRVLEMLLKAGQPVKAYDLIAAFGDGGPPAKPPTVYRALDFLSKLGSGPPDREPERLHGLWRRRRGPYSGVPDL
jgi:DNA-binding PadR family transcriptional regulator